MAKRKTPARKKYDKKVTQYNQRASIRRKMQDADSFECYLKLKKQLDAIQ